MFERSLSDLIRGLRSHRGKDEPKYVSLLLTEIRSEVRSGDLEVKSSAILKLTYLQMLGYPPFSGAHFHMLETMASSRYHHKHIGYLAASQCFTPDTDVLILATNMIKKDLLSANPLDVAIALNGLASIATPDLARHLGGDVVKLLTHSKGAVRKKSLLVLYGLIVKAPELLEQSWERLREKLEDGDAGVVSAAVNIICELARRDPRPFLPLSPQLFRLLTTSTNNWMLIKIIKLFGSLTPLEPRLVKKLVPPITTIISTTPAMSLLYECIHTIIIGGMLSQPGGDELAEICVEKLAGFLGDTDQNLKYIALLALVKILPSHPGLVGRHQEVIFESIEDPDLSIRLRALELVSGMAVSRNLESIVGQLLSHLEPQGGGGLEGAAAALKASLVAGAAGADADPTSSSLAAATANNPTLSPSYRLEIVERILALGSYDTYANVVDFSWWLDTLLHLSTVPNLPEGNTVGGKIRDQLIDITARVKAIRPHATLAMRRILDDGRLIPTYEWTSSNGALVASKTGGGGEEMKESRKVLHAAAWILGEYSSSLPPSLLSGTILLLLRPALYSSTLCPTSTSAACVHAAIKIYAYFASSISSRWSESGLKPQADFEDLVATTKEVSMRLEAIQGSSLDAEVQERSGEYRLLFRLIEADLEARTEEGKDGESKPPKSLDLLSPLFFNHTLGPLGAGAQARVAPPFELDLHSWIVPPEDYIVLDSIDLATHPDPEAELDEQPAPSTPKATIKESRAEQRKAREERLQRQREDPFYLVDSKEVKREKEAEMEDLDHIPIVRLDNLISPIKEERFEKVRPAVLEEEEMPEPQVRGSKKKSKSKIVAEAEGEEEGTPTKVVKVKKKKSSTPRASSKVTID